MVIAGCANVLQYFFAITYQKHWWLFLFLFVGIAVPGIYFTTSLQDSAALHSTTGMLFGSGAGFLYVAFLTWWGRSFSIDDMYRVDSIPTPYRQLLKPNLYSALVKLSEIAIQDLVLLVIVLSLNQMTSYLYASLAFSLIVFLVHIPSPMVLGKLYGSILMVLATLGALVVPYVIGELTLGIYYVFACHLAVYMLLLVWSRIQQVAYSPHSRY